jgi:hypothetical protein
MATVGTLVRRRVCQGAANTFVPRRQNGYTRVLSYSCSPDGDLGSNEILLANERTIGVVDGSGVLYDPEGLDAEELRRECLLWRRMNRPGRDHGTVLRKAWTPNDPPPRIYRSRRPRARAHDGQELQPRQADAAGFPRARESPSGWGRKIRCPHVLATCMLAITSDA